MLHKEDEQQSACQREAPTVGGTMAATIPANDYGIYAYGAISSAGDSLAHPSTDGLPQQYCDDATPAEAGWPLRVRPRRARTRGSPVAPADGALQRPQQLSRGWVPPKEIGRESWH